VASVLAACGGQAGQAGQAAQTGATKVAAAAAETPDSTSVTQKNLGACGTQSRTITDATGTSVSITGVPTRVVTIEPSFADDASAVGVTPVGIGDDNDSGLLIPQIKSRISSYTSLGTRESPNFAVIAGLHPDLILADPVGNRKIMSQLRAVAPTVAVWSQHTDYLQNLAAARLVGVALNKCDQMNAVLSKHEATMAAIKAKVPAGESRTFIYGLATDKNFTVFNYQQYATTVLQSLGLRPAATDPAKFHVGDAQGIALETLVELNPQVIFYSNVLNNPSGILDSWQQGSIFKSSAASKAHTVFKVDQHGWSLMRGISGSEVIAAEAVNVLYGK
jgi:iron complex transport system substrate-binding protein